MVAVKGRFQNNRFVSEEDITIPDEASVIVTILDTGTTHESAEALKLLEDIQLQSARAGLDTMAMDEIDAEIKAYRAEKRKA